MNSFFVKMWFGTVLSLMSSFMPTWLTRENIAPPLPQILVQAPLHKTKVLPSPKAAPVVQAQVRPNMLCRVSGRATYNGLPYGNADVDLWITTPRTQVVRRLKTHADGSFRLALRLRAEANEPLDWEISAHTVDQKTVHQAGRRIVRVGESTISIDKALHLVVAD